MRLMCNSLFFLITFQFGRKDKWWVPWKIIPSIFHSLSQFLSNQTKDFSCLPSLLSIFPPTKHSLSENKLIWHKKLCPTYTLMVYKHYLLLFIIFVSFHENEHITWLYKISLAMSSSSNGLSSHGRARWRLRLWNQDTPGGGCYYYICMHTHFHSSQTLYFTQTQPPPPPFFCLSWKWTHDIIVLDIFTR